MKRRLKDNKVNEWRNERRRGKKDGRKENGSYFEMCMTTFLLWPFLGAWQRRKRDHYIVQLFENLKNAFLYINIGDKI